MMLENTCTWFDFPRGLFVCYLVFGVILLSESIIYVIACLSDPVSVPESAFQQIRL